MSQMDVSLAACHPARLEERVALGFSRSWLVDLCAGRVNLTKEKIAVLLPLVAELQVH